jgi:hypothetical protein
VPKNINSKCNTEVFSGPDSCYYYFNSKTDKNYEVQAFCNDKTPNCPDLPNSLCGKHTVTSGDTCYSIAKQYNTTVDRLSWGINFTSVSPQAPCPSSLYPGQIVVWCPETDMNRRKYDSSCLLEIQPTGTYITPGCVAYPGKVNGCPE